MQLITRFLATGPPFGALFETLHERLNCIIDCVMIWISLLICQCLKARSFSTV